MNASSGSHPDPPPTAIAALDVTRRGIAALPAETVPITDATGRVLREPVLADRALPACDRSRMDGYALRSSEYRPDTPMPVSGEIRAGDDGRITIPPGTCVKIATGAPIPDGLDVVIEHERSDRADPVRFELDAVAPGRSIHARGVDVSMGAELLPVGTGLRAHHVGLLATVGCTRPVVSRRPRVGVISSGDELVGIDQVPEPHQVREGNAPMIAALLEELGGAVVHRAHAPDRREATRATLVEALEATDLLVTIGGISAGEHDLVRPVLEELGVTWWIAGAPIKPGKPIHVGHAPDGTIVACLPGNPVSALVTANLFCRPIIEAMTGRTDAPGWEPRRLAEPVRRDPVRTLYRPARLLADGRVEIPAWRGSGDLAHLAACTGIIEIAVDESNARTGDDRHPYLDWRTA